MTPAIVTTARRLTAFRLVQVAAACAMAAACASSPAPPASDAQQQPFPDIGGQRVMLLPVQSVIPAVSPPANVDSTRHAVALTADLMQALESEIAYWMPEHARRVRWVLPEAIVRAAEGSAALEISPRALPIRDFQRSRLERIGDPLYGDLRRLSAVTDARLALLPIGAVWIPEVGGLGRVHVAAALLDTVGGRVLWYGVVAGSPGDLEDTAVVASAARALALQVPQ